MPTLLLLMWLQVAPAQPAPTPPAAAVRQTTPAATQPRPRPAAPAATTTLQVTVTDGLGAPLAGVTVALIGGVDRQGVTSDDGRIRLLGVPAGTHRLRFERDGYHTFEKELTWRAGQAAPSLSVTLSSAPKPPEPPPPPAPAAAAPPEPALPPPASPRTLVLPDYIERHFIGPREPQKENLVGCSGVGQALVWQVRDTWTGRSHPGADAMLYVIGGDGTLRLADSDVTIAAGSFAVVPRGTTYGFTRRGRNPLIVLAFLAGPPCAAD